MPYAVSNIVRADENGNYKLTLEDAHGVKIDAIIPPQMEAQVALSIQESRALRESDMAGMFGGILMLGVLQSAVGQGRNAPGERTLVIETHELGSWGLRMTKPVVEAMIANLKSLLGEDPQTRH